MSSVSDLLIIGGGPAGLCAAINGASEGLNIKLFDSGLTLGGQAKESSAIENYPGFPEGITGDLLMSSFVRQAEKFNTEMYCPVTAVSLVKDDKGVITVLTDDFQEYHAQSVLISSGLSYRRLTATGLGPLMGRGVYYGAPTGKLPLNKACNISVVGGANSAGQAVINLAQNKKSKIKLLIRKTIEHQMSQYLIDRIRKLSNVEICEGCEVVEASGKTCLSEIKYNVHDQAGAMITEGISTEMDYMFIFIGAAPRTYWLNGLVDMDDKKFIKTWNDLDHSDILMKRAALPYETSIPGVFAAGDVRLGSTKRIASAVGEGAMALQMVHNYLGGL